jgi:RNA polymerase sigma-70 factor (ECF subfamily)
MPTLDIAPTCVDYASKSAPDHFLALYSEHANSARALASRLLYDRCEAEDVVHDVFLTLWRRPARFDPQRGTSRSWLLTVVRNRSLDHLRLRRSRPLADTSELADRLPDTYASNALDEFIRATDTALLWRLVDALPTSQAELIRRAFAGGETHQQIAEATGLPLGTVKGRIRLGLEKLRRSMRNAGTTMS